MLFVYLSKLDLNQIFENHTILKMKTLLPLLWRGGQPLQGRTVDVFILKTSCALEPCEVGQHAGGPRVAFPGNSFQFSTPERGGVGSAVT